MELFAKESRRLDDARNRPIWGDNKLVMASLLAEFKGRVDLIYIDPSFDVGADFTIGRADRRREGNRGQRPIDPGEGRLPRHVGKGTDSYLHMMSERLTLMKEALISGRDATWRVSGRGKPAGAGAGGSVGIGIPLWPACSETGAGACFAGG